MQKDDEVDLVVSAWSDILPDLDLSPLDVMSRLRRVSVELNDVRRTAFRRAGLELWEFDVLAALRRTPSGELSASQLTKATMIGSAAMSTRLKNLATRGLIERRYDHRDQRVALAWLTDEGRTRVEHAMTQLVEDERRLLEVLTPHDREHLVRILRRLGDVEK
jgi:DNA-binding MarR family transcriptional regulator